jgi:hypothetical protein
MCWKVVLRPIFNNPIMVGGRERGERERGGGEGRERDRRERGEREKERGREGEGRERKRGERERERGGGSIISMITNMIS